MKDKLRYCFVYEASEGSNKIAMYLSEDDVVELFDHYHKGDIRETFGNVKRELIAQVRSNGTSNWQCK